MNATRRVTANLPGDLLEEAMQVTGKGVTETLVTALRLVRRTRAYDKAMALRGKVRLTIDLDRVSGLVVDTSVWIDLFAGRPVPALEDGLAQGVIALPPVVVAELVGVAVSTPDAHVAQCALDRDALLLARDDVFGKIARQTSLRVTSG